MKLALAVVAVGLAVLPVMAHHSVEAQYDMEKVVTIQGAVLKLVWVNPHALIWVDTSNGASPVSSWEMELPPPNALKIRNVNADFVKEGDQVTVTLWRAKDGSRLGHALTLTTPTGQVLDFPQLLKMRTVAK
jgi:hypothetical protein